MSGLKVNIMCITLQASNFKLWMESMSMLNMIQVITFCYYQVVTKRACQGRSRSRFVVVSHLDMDMYFVIRL